MSLTIKKILAVLGFVAVAILAVTRVEAEPPPYQSPCGRVLTNTQKHVWMTPADPFVDTFLTWPAECTDEPIWSGFRYTENNYIAWAWVVVQGATPAFTWGELWANGVDLGSGPTGGGKYVFRRSANLLDITVQKTLNEWLDGLRPRPTFYIGQVTSGVVTSAFDAEGIPMLGGFALDPAYPEELRTLSIMDIDAPEIVTPGGCRPECQQLEKPAGPGTPSTWGQTKGLYR